MFWVIQMLSLTEFAAGSSVSTFTAFAITSVSLLAVLPPAPRRSAASAAAGGEHNRREGREHGRSPCAPRAVGAGRRRVREVGHG